MDALLRFAAVARMASLRERKRCRRRASCGRSVLREQGLLIELRLHEEMMLTDTRKRRTVTYLPNTASSQIESGLRPLRPACADRAAQFENSLPILERVFSVSEKC